MDTLEKKKRVQYLKKDCHKLMEEIWGTGLSGNARAYYWLKTKFKKSIHFSEIDDHAELTIIKDAVFVKSVNGDLVDDWDEAGKKRFKELMEQ